MSQPSEQLNIKQMYNHGQLLDFDDTRYELEDSLQQVSERWRKEGLEKDDVAFTETPDGTGVKPWITENGVIRITIARRNELLQKIPLNEAEMQDLNHCFALIQSILLRRIITQLALPQTDENEAVNKIAQHLNDLQPEYNRKANTVSIPMKSCVPAPFRKFIKSKFIKITNSLCLKLYTFLTADPKHLLMSKEDFAGLIWDCSDEKIMVDQMMEERKKKKDLDNSTDDAGNMKNDLYKLIKEFNLKVRLKDVSDIIDTIKKHIDYSNDLMLNMTFQSQRQEDNKPKVLEKNKNTLQKVNDFALKINQTFLTINATQTQLIRRHKQLHADIHKFIDRNEFDKAEKLIAELQALFNFRNKCCDSLQSQYTELLSLAENLETQHKAEVNMKHSQNKENEKKFAIEEQRMLEILKEIDEKLKVIALTEETNRKINEATEARRKRWDEQQKKREEERKEKEEKMVNEKALQKIINTPYEPSRSAIILFSKRKTTQSQKPQAILCDSSNVHSKSSPMPLKFDSHCDLGALLQYNNELHILHSLLQQMSFDEKSKSAAVCRMERSALLGIMGRAMECLKIKQSGGIIHQVAKHFRNVIFHGFEENLFPKIGEEVKENAEANRNIFDMACRLLAFLHSPKVKQLKSLEDVLLAMDSELFTSLMKHTVKAPELRICQEQILLGDYELLQYEKAKRELGQNQGASTLYHAAVGFSQARIGTYASFIRRQPEKAYLSLFHQLKQSMPLKNYIREGINFRHVLTNIKCR